MKYCTTVKFEFEILNDCVLTVRSNACTNHLGERSEDVFEQRFDKVKVPRSMAYFEEELGLEGQEGSSQIPRL